MEGRFACSACLICGWFINHEKFTMRILLVEPTVWSYCLVYLYWTLTLVLRNELSFAWTFLTSCLGKDSLHSKPNEDCISRITKMLQLHALQYSRITAVSSPTAKLGLSHLDGGWIRVDGLVFFQTNGGLNVLTVGSSPRSLVDTRASEKPGCRM